MNIQRLAAVAAVLCTLALSAYAESREASFFRELDADGDGSITPQEFTLQKSVIFYMLDSNHDLKLERNETKLTATQFKKYAKDDGSIDGLELFDLPAARFYAFDADGDQRITASEFHQQLANLRGGGSQTAEERQ